MNNGVRNNRVTIFDYLKGIAIILMVLGHVLHAEGRDSSLVFIVIYSFHMPLLMYVSGRLAYRTNRRIDKVWLCKRSEKLLIPYFVWLVIYNGSEGVLGIVYRLKGVLKGESNGLWFLLTLFLICSILFLCETLENVTKVHSEYFMLFFFAVINFYVLFLNRSENDWLQISKVAWYMPFYLGGYIYSKYQERLKKIVSILVFVSGFFYLISISSYERFGFHFPQIELLYENGLDYKIAFLLALGLNYLVAFGGIAITYVLLLLGEKIGLVKILDKVAFLGRYTMEIYILHYYFYVFWGINSGSSLEILLNTSAGILFPVVVAVGIEKFGVKRWLFGR